MLPSLDALRATILQSFPDLADAQFTLLTAGWDSVAVDVDDQLIFKFPRDADAEASLRREARLLGAVRPIVHLSVPDLTIVPGPPLFSRHVKLPGDHLVTAEYEHLPEDARQRLAETMARFYADVHTLDANVMASLGAKAVDSWSTPETILSRALAALSSDRHDYVRGTIAAWEALPPDPHGSTYGFFDGHGWNMAFDHNANALSGIYDFADSGFGPLHQEFIYTNFISPDLTERIVTAYEAITKHALDRERIALLTRVHSLWELSNLADDPAHAPDILGNVLRWADARG